MPWPNLTSNRTCPELSIVGIAECVAVNGLNVPVFRIAGFCRIIFLQRRAARGWAESVQSSELGDKNEVSYPRIVTLTTLAMIAFAGNSLLCRVALKETDIDAASFTTIRLISGALILWLIVRMNRGSETGSWLSAFALFVYAAGFSFAYVSLPAATGALLLFGAVQALSLIHI